MSALASRRAIGDALGESRLPKAASSTPGHKQQIGHNSLSGTQTQLVVTVANAPAAESSYIGLFRGGTIASISDSRGNTWSVYTFAAVAQIQVIYCLSPTPLQVGDTVTINFGSSGNPGAQIEEYGALTALDQTATAQNSVATTGPLTAGPTSTTAQASETLITFCGVNGSPAPSYTPPGAPWTERPSNNGTGANGDMADQVVASTGTFSATWSWSISRRAAVVVTTWKNA